MTAALSIVRTDPLTVLNENFQTGAFTALDNGDNLTFSGTVSGANINFTDVTPFYDNGPQVNVLKIEGSIAANGTMSGPVNQEQSNGGTDWGGSFWTVSGEATPIESVPEPNSIALFGYGLSALAFLRQRGGWRGQARKAEYLNYNSEFRA